ncbi:SH3 domain-containing protein [Sediminibacillus dalangtanensis]|uniref:SH3 domain-containing protein n=2 Tax=Sediminibacillus dalangtanensis TaxID=2729421 RepID=A0ABX7VR58_9BACI|nr:SH3 domain-containing protein [Sediminibacillus dalangtanensis]
MLEEYRARQLRQENSLIGRGFLMNRLITLTAGAVLLLLSLLLAPSVMAADNETYMVDVEDGSSLLIRDEPTSSGEVVGKLQNGDQVTVFDEAYGWVKTYYDNQVGWVASQYLFPMEQNHDSLHKRKQTAMYKKQSVSSLTERKVQKQDSVAIKNGQEQSQTVEPLTGYTIVLDAGHGGKDPGAIGIDGTYEKDLTLATASKVAKNLKASGATIIMTRNDDTYISLEKRIKISNRSDTDAFISFHYNSFPIETVGGISTYHYTEDEDLELAENIQSGIMDHVSLKDNGTKQADYRVLKKNSDLSVLIELGFVSNPAELGEIKTETYQDNVAAGISEGIQHYFSH